MRWSLPTCSGVCKRKLQHEYETFDHTPDKKFCPLPTCACCTEVLSGHLPDEGVSQEAPGKAADHPKQGPQLQMPGALLLRGEPFALHLLNPWRLYDLCHHTFLSHARISGSTWLPTGLTHHMRTYSMCTSQHRNFQSCLCLICLWKLFLFGER